MQIELQNNCPIVFKNTKVQDRDWVKEAKEIWQLIATVIPE